MDPESQKHLAAEYAAGLVEDGMAVGLGSGTTAHLAVRILKSRLEEGLSFTGVPTSEATADLAQSLGIALRDLNECQHLDLVIDGADEVDPRLNLIKGHGGALLREKIVAEAGARLVIVVDESKRVNRLGQRAPVPVEVIRFGWMTTKARVEKLGLPCQLRGGENPYRTDSNNFILDCYAPDSIDLSSRFLAESLKNQTGVVEHGLFLGLATTVVVGKESGETEVLEAQKA